MSRDVARRILSAAGYLWRRMRRSLDSKRDQAAFEQCHAELLELHQQELAGQLAMYYLDQVGFSLQPVVPYGWLKPESLIGISSGPHQKRVNVLGLMQCNGDFDSYMFTESINSEIVVACIDAFIRRLRAALTDLPVVIVLDNASIQTKPLEKHLQRWREQGVQLKYLPTYCPELNMIEILWHRIKYYWLPLEATESWEALLENVEYVLKNIGSKYQLTFA